MYVDKEAPLHTVCSGC